MRGRERRVFCTQRLVGMMADAAVAASHEQHRDISNRGDRHRIMARARGQAPLRDPVSLDACSELIHEPRRAQRGVEFEHVGELDFQGAPGSNLLKR